MSPRHKILPFAAYTCIGLGDNSHVILFLFFVDFVLDNMIKSIVLSIIDITSFEILEECRSRVAD